jgi:hypothetical protein
LISIYWRRRFAPSVAAVARGGTHQIVLTFAGDVTVTDLEVTSTDNQATATLSYNGPVLTVNLSQVANAQTTSIKLVNVSDEINTGDVVIPFRVLLGDTNGTALSPRAISARRKARPDSR